MKISIEQILTRELVGKEVLIHKYGTEDNFFYSTSETGEENYVGCNYAKITDVCASFDDPGCMYLEWEESEFFPDTSIDILMSDDLELREKD